MYIYFIRYSSNYTLGTHIHQIAPSLNLIQKSKLSSALSNKLWEQANYDNLCIVETDHPTKTNKNPKP